MNWKREAAELLKDYGALKESLVALEEQIAHLESDYKSLKSARADGTPVKGGGNGREDALLTNIVQRDELCKNLEAAKLRVKQVDRGLSVLNDTQRKVLERFYIYRVSGFVDKLCDELNVEQATVYRIKNEALRRFTLATYGRTES